MQFSWINEWEELVDARGHCHGVEFVLPEWFTAASSTVLSS
jgi:hypothetical protein